MSDQPEHVTFQADGKHWTYRIDPDGACGLVDGDQREPQWVQQAAARYAKAIQQQDQALARRSDAMKALQDVWPPMAALARQALHEAPQGRQHAKQLANKLQAIGQRDGVPDDLKTWAQQAERSLRDHIKRTAPPARADDSGPTPETKAKFRQRKKDTLDRLYETGGLGGDEHSAGEEIRDIYEAVSKRMDARARDYRDVKVQTSMGMPRDPVGAIPGKLARLHADVYTPWCREMRQTPAVREGNSARGSLYDLAMDVLIEGKSVRAVERDYGVRNGKGAERLVTALERYARLRRQPPDEPAKWPYPVDVPAAG